jgi:rod shape-determining protein MreC
MSGLDIQKGKLEYIKSEKLINKDNQKLIVVTSGSAGIFKSGIPIGKIDSTNILDSKEIVVNFYRDFSQLKYVKILSYKNVSKITEIKNQYDKTNNQNNNNKILQQKNIINEQIINKFEKENTKLKEKLINLTKQMKIQKNEIKDNQSKIKNIKFLELNLLYGPKCRKNLFRPNLYKINTDEYRNCIFNKGIIKNN